jgi:hypothetical protein
VPKSEVIALLWSTGDGLVDRECRELIVV